MKRVITVMGIVALMPLLMGAGGNSPGFVAGKIAGPQFLANVVLDPHEVDVPIHPGNGTSTAKQASIRIYKDHNTAAAMFHIPPGGSFGLALGCDLSLTEGRFRYVPLIQWIPEPVLNQLFETLGEPRSTGFEPIITQILNDECTPDPANPTTSDGSPPGILSFQATIRFLAPK